jgi:hypothetical protein
MYLWACRPNEEFPKRHGREDKTKNFPKVSVGLLAKCRISETAYGREDKMKNFKKYLWACRPNEEFPKRPMEPSEKHPKRHVDL